MSKCVIKNTIVIDDGWKVLVADNVPPDILVKGKYEFKYYSQISHEWLTNTINRVSEILRYLQEGSKYIYRLSPEIKKDEQLAKEYAFDVISKMMQDDVYYLIQKLIKDAFLAGIKAKEKV